MRPLPPTAGDWFAEFDAHTDPAWAVVARPADGRRVELAAVFDGPGVPLEAAAANANLMAQAPRLLAALRRALVELRGRPGTRDLVADLELAVGLAGPAAPTPETP